MRRCPFSSPQAAVDALLDSAPLRDLASLHGADIALIHSPQGLLDEIQRLWVPKASPGTVTKIRSLPLAALNAEIPASVQTRSWELLDALGFTSCFDAIPPDTKFGAVLAHGTKPPYALANFQRLHGLATTGVDLGREILLLSSASVVDEAQRVATLYPNHLWQSPPPETEIGSMVWLWEALGKPDSLRRMTVTPVCASHIPSTDPSKPPRSPNTEQALRAMPERHFTGDILVVSGRIEQTLRQDEITRAVLSNLGMNCRIHTMGVYTQDKPLLIVTLREVATTLWERMRRT